MAFQTAEPLPVRLKRWRRALRTGLDRAMKAAPTVLLLGGAALGFIYSVGAESWITVGFFTLLGTMLGGAVLLAARFVASNLSTVVRGAVILGAAILVWFFAIVIVGGVIVAAYQMLVSGIRSLLGI